MKNPSVELSADFSAIDSEYTPGEETIVDLGSGKFQISYSISEFNVRPAGEYEIPIKAELGSVTRYRSLSTRWLPLGAPRKALASAELISTGASARPLEAGTTITSISVQAHSIQGSFGMPMLFDPLIDDVGGWPFTITFSSSEPIDDRIRIEMYWIRMYSVTRDVPGDRVTVARWVGSPIDYAFDLTDESSDYSVYWADLTTFDPPFGGSEHDLGTLTIGLDSEPNMARAVHIVDNTAKGLDYWLNFTDPHDYDWINVIWLGDQPELPESPESPTPYSSSLTQIHPSLIYLRQEATVPFVVNHELSHYVHKHFMHSDATTDGNGGDSYGRFGEPMANVNAGAITGSWLTGWRTYSPEDMDFNGTYEPDAGGQNIPGFVQADLLFFDEHDDYLDCNDRPSCCPANPADPANPQCVQGSYGWTWRIYWDLHDPSGNEPWETFYLNDGSGPESFGDFDHVNGGSGSPNPLNHKLTRVLFEYLGGGYTQENPNRDDRGIAQVDIVDVLDGATCLGFTDQSETEELLEDVMAFDYDFAKEGISCVP